MTLYSILRRLGAFVATLAAVALIVFAPAGVAFAAPGDFTAAPTILDFGDVPIGGEAVLSITLTNSSAAAATPSLSGSGATGDLSLVGNCSDPVAPAATCTVDVTFRPSAVGPLSGSLFLHVDGISISTTVTGAGVVPITYALAPPTLDFGDVAVGESATRSATLTNTSVVAASPIVGGTATGPFAFGSGTCLTTLDPGESCVGEIVFTPTAAGPASGSAEMTVDGTPVGTIALLGTGVAATTVTVVDPDDTIPTEPDATPTDTPTESTRSQLPRTGPHTVGLVLMAATCLAFGASAMTFRRAIGHR